MKRLSGKRPSPALVISIIALFVAMGGTGYAVSKNSVGTKQLKNNAVTSKKLRKSAVITSKIKKDAVTGDKIKESSLSKVPDSDKLDGLDATAFERASTNKPIRIAVFSLGNGETKDIYSLGPLKLTAKCAINDGGSDKGIVLISTTQDNAAFDGDDTRVLNTTTPEVNRYYVYTSNVTGTPNIDQEASGAAVAPDGSQFVSQLWSGVNLFGQVGRCQFGGLIDQVS